jgi:hypothetical protein
MFIIDGMKKNVSVYNFVNNIYQFNFNLILSGIIVWRIQATKI